MKSDMHVRKNIYITGKMIMYKSKIYYYGYMSVINKYIHRYMHIGVQLKIVPRW